MAATVTEQQQAPQAAPKTESEQSGTGESSKIKSALKGHDFATQEKMLSPPDERPPSA